jgi:hypothetical protein
VRPNAFRGPESDQNPTLPITPFTIHGEFLTSTAAIDSVNDSQFVAPPVHPSIEHPYPDRVRRKRERPRSNAPI